METFTVVISVFLLAAGIFVTKVIQSRKVASGLRDLIGAQLLLSGTINSTFDPYEHQFVTGYLIKFSADYADIHLPKKRWGLVWVGLNFVFGNRAPSSRVEEFAEQFSSPEFIAGVSAGANDIQALQRGQAIIGLANYLRKNSIG